MNCAYDGEWQIRVNSSGILNVLEGSNITAYDPEYVFFFYVYGRLVMRDSFLSRCYELCLRTTEGVELYNTTISNGLYGIDCWDSSDISITGCTISNNEDGIDCWDSSDISITGCTISNGLYGIVCDGSSNIAVHYCNIYSNQYHGLYNYGEYVVNATYCWWGSPDGPEYKAEGDPDDPEEVYSYYGPEYLIYEPWLEEPRLSPWADTDGDGVPNYVDIPEFSVVSLATVRIIELKIWPRIKVGEIYWPVSIYVISPATSISNMLEELGKWGVSYEDYKYYLVLPIVVEIHDLSDLLNWLSKKLPEELIDAAVNTLCTDGVLRLMVLPMIKFIPTELGIDDPIDLLKTFKELVKGDVGAVLDKLMDLLTAFDVALYLIKEGEPVQAIYVTSWGDIVRNLKHIRGLIEDMGQIIIEVLGAMAAGTLTGGATIAALALKAFNFIVDYIVEWLPIPNELVGLLNYVKGILSFKDPEGVRIDVQILNTTSGRLILGYDPATGENYTYFDHGFWFYDEDKQVFLISKDALPLNLTIICSSTRQSLGEDIEVNYSLTIIDPGFSETEVFGGLLSVNEATSSIMELTADGELKVSPLRLCVSFSNAEPIQGEDVLVSVNVTDEAGNPVSGAEVELSIDGVFLAVEEVGPGRFRAVIDTSMLFGMYVVRILAEAEGYLQSMVIHAIKVLDVTPPVVEVLQPLNESYLMGTQVIRITGSDVVLDKIELYIDGVLVATWNMSGVHDYEWDTTAWSDGAHTIMVIAFDKAGNRAEKSIIVVIDNTPPVIGTPSMSPEQPVEGEDVEISVEITDTTSGVMKVILSYSVNEGITWVNITMMSSDSVYKAVIPAQAVGAKVLYKIYACDKAGNRAESPEYSYTVRATAGPPGYGALVFTVACIVVIIIIVIALWRRRKGKTPSWGKELDQRLRRAGYSRS